MVDEQPTSYDDQLFAVVDDLIAAEHYPVAVVVCQLVMELKAEVAFLVLFSLNTPRSTDVLMDLVPDRSFMDKRTRALWTELTGDSLTANKPRWKSYKEHVERRNVAAHGAGLLGGVRAPRITRQQATNSVEAVRSMSEHIGYVLEQQVIALTSRGDRDQFRALRAISPRPELD
jgi:hypothetical protein